MLRANRLRTREDSLTPGLWQWFQCLCPQAPIITQRLNKNIQLPSVYVPSSCLPFTSYELIAVTIIYHYRTLNNCNIFPAFTYMKRRRSLRCDSNSIWSLIPLRSLRYGRSTKVSTNLRVDQSGPEPSMYSSAQSGLEGGPDGTSTKYTIKKPVPTGTVPV
jgi:hypothetical protein